jgi:hypothetical protein
MPLLWLNAISLLNHVPVHKSGPTIISKHAGHQLWQKTNAYEDIVHMIGERALLKHRLPLRFSPPGLPFCLLKQMVYLPNSLGQNGLQMQCSLPL